MPEFKIRSEFRPTGDQPQAIDVLAEGIEQGLRDQTLMGVTGSGKTFTMANIIERVQRPTLVIAHNKTLAAQLCSEFKEFFPDNAVEYFVSYYDYYQPEAYVPSSDTYIEKDASINDEIDKLRHSATAALAERRDVIIVASVSCIYSMGDPSEYSELSISLRPGMEVSREHIISQLVDIQYERNDVNFIRGTFRVRGDVLEIFPTGSSDTAIRVEFFGDEIDRISEIQTVTGKATATLNHAMIFPATHYATSKDKLEEGMADIERDMKLEAEKFREQGKLIEEQRITQRTKYDMEMMREIGYCSGIENYSRYFDGRKPGDPPFTLLDYFPRDFLVFIDESHRTVSQIGAMYAGDYSRKKMLIDYGFRLHSAFDNRPLRFEEFRKRTGQTVYFSATPGKFELEQSSRIAEQIIRPTGLCDPEIDIRPIATQVDDLIGEIRQTTAKGYRTLVTTLTKKMAENLTDYLKELDIRVQYLHSDVETLDRMKILRSLRLGEFDVLVGINLLREGLDIPEVGLVAILDADKEGFLRSDSALIQTIGRAARNVDGHVVMYADVMTDSMRRAIDETNRRRAIQLKYNEEHHITPQSIKKTVRDLLEITAQPSQEQPEQTQEADESVIRRLEKEMKAAAQELDYERAAQIRDRLLELKALTWEEKK
ncbi:MAG: excinuclease ABC subunit UvrB [Eubacteriales bacterium]|nr:excinuclease ABC subunit UvrB [Eubacteriales bacterium]